MSANSELSRDLLFKDAQARLEHLTFLAIKKGVKPDEIIAMAINVDDPKWKEVVQVIMPDATEKYWQDIRDKGAIPTVRGTALAEDVCGYFAEVCPAIASALLDRLPEGNQVRTVVVSDGDGSVYYVVAFPHFRDC